ncbi:MAG: hypothetical protein JSU58_04895 [Dehalococcoidales bacterium]|nr:MAG: hypothetical protein JSU58_04895 [Dehalococcoidales bacterium]
MRIVLSLFLLVSALTIFTTSGCSYRDIPVEEEKIMAENINSVFDSNMNEGYKTATFALG